MLLTSRALGFKADQTYEGDCKRNIYEEENLQAKQESSRRIEEDAHTHNRPGDEPRNIVTPSKPP